MPPSEAVDVLSLFLAGLDAHPGRPAAKDLTVDLSYAELAQQVALVADGLAGRGVGAGDRVAIHLPNSVDFLVAALASLWLGAAFVPLAVTDPPGRLAVILGDCEPAVVVGDPLPPSLSAHSQVGLSEVAGGTAEMVEPIADDSQRVAYLIYTSGTTGTPKGVCIPNGAFASAAHAVVRSLDLGADTRTLCVSPFHFDGSFGTLFPTLVAGGSVMIPPRDSLLFARTFFNTVGREAITYTGFSPSYLHILLDSPHRDRLAATPLQVIALGGEACTAADVQALWDIKSDLRVFNRYGPTETTIAVTHYEVKRSDIGRGTVPIGKPHRDVSFSLIDDQGLPVTEDGAVGELYVGGDQLMSGYWGAPQLTAEVLRTDIVAGETVYKTGDLVYRNEAGDYVYVDRADRVVKRSGVRVSLIELAGVLRGLPGVSAATCVAFDDQGLLGIVAFVVADASVAALELKRGAADLLPDTMLPDRIVTVDALPLTTSSKVDERALLAAAGLREAPKRI